jgi:hypothetical protein
MAKLLITTLLLVNINCFSQTIFKKHEILLPLQPYTLLAGSKFVQYERYQNSKKSYVFTVGHQAEALVYHMWSRMDKYSGIRFDISKRWYYVDNEKALFRPYISVNAMFEKSSFKLRKTLDIPSDSLNAKGFTFAPEINAGFKLILFKRITVNPMLGLRYYFNTYNINKITNNEKYWAYDDWDNGNPIWQENRKVVELRGFRKGLAIIPYFNFGYRF